MLAVGWGETCWVVPVNVRSKQPQKEGGFEWLPPTSKWASQIPPLKWAYFLTACLPLCMDPPESSLHRNTHKEVGGVEERKRSVTKSRVWFRSIDGEGGGVLFSVPRLPKDTSEPKVQWAIKYSGVCQLHKGLDQIPNPDTMEMKDSPAVYIEVEFFGLCLT